MSTASRLAGAAIAVLAVAACTAGRPPGARPTAPVAGSPSAAASDRGTLADEQLRPFVPGADDVPEGMELSPEDSGPAGVDEISSYSSDPEAKEHELQEHRLQAGYAVQYVDPSTGALLSVYVARFASATDARAIYAAEVAESERDAQRIRVSDLGDEAAGFRQPVREGDIAELVTLRVRLGDLTWTVRTGGPDRADEALARRVAETVVGRAA